MSGSASFLPGLSEAALAASVLPEPGLQQIGLHLGWAMVLAALVTVLATRLAPRWRLGLSVAVAVAALVPGPGGVVWWLGLAFQSPSIASMAVAAAWLMGPAFTAAPHPSVTLAPSHDPAAGAAGAANAVGVVSARVAVPAVAVALLGWLMLLDTLALLPWMLYPSGYGFGALAGLLGLATVLCVLPASRMAGAALLLVGAVFAVTRLPTGNLWDALLDPWLWLLAQALLVRAALGAVRRRRLPPGLRA